jgi:hypothetical protein
MLLEASKVREIRCEFQLDDSRILRSELWVSCNDQRSLFLQFANPHLSPRRGHGEVDWLEFAMNLE